MTVDDCPICKDGSEFVYRLKEAERGIAQHKDEVKVMVSESEDRCMSALKEFKDDFRWFKNSAWMILCGGILSLLSVIVDKLI